MSKKMDTKGQQRQRPNIIIILADDLGFSEIGCFGSEIYTPNIDSLATTGIQFTQMYNCATMLSKSCIINDGFVPASGRYWTYGKLRK